MWLRLNADTITKELHIMLSNEQILARMAEDMKLRGLAAGTRASYSYNAGRFLSWAGLSAELMGEEEIRAYLQHQISHGKLGASTVNVCNAALRFLFAVTLNRGLNYRLLPRMKKARALPEILTKGELLDIFDNANTLQNKAMLMTIYGSGLRVSEACKLKTRDVDSEAMRVFVRCGKGGKDRYTLLSRNSLEMLRTYWQSYSPKHPDGWLFLSKDRLRNAHVRTVQSAFKAAAERAGITKNVSTHTLRACFATHLLEAGADIYRIKQLLGHNQIQSTTFYLRLLNYDSALTSPLDSMPVGCAGEPGGGVSQ